MTTEKAYRERWECRCPACGVDVARVPPCPVCGNHCCPCVHGEERADQRAAAGWDRRVSEQ